jgi:hypothetical protein
LILFVIMLIIIAILMVVSVAVLSVCGAGAIILFGDVIVCIWLLVKLVKWYRRRK